jgi:hypothetical protein
MRINMNKKNLRGSTRQCAAVRGSASGASGSVCVVVGTLVCAQCTQQCAAMFLETYGSAHDNVQLSGSAAVRQCATVRRVAVRQCAAVRQ